MTAAELADNYQRFIDGESAWFSRDEQLQVIRELRRIAYLEQRLAEAERRALTDEDVLWIRETCHAIWIGFKLSPDGNIRNGLKAILSRIAPSPPVVWTEPQPGIHVAACNGWSLCVMPSDSDLANEWRWSASRVCRKTMVDWQTGLDAAKAAAVKWAMENTK